MSSNIVMPQLGESVVEGTVGKWLKQVGDKIEQYESVLEVITDKVTTEIPSPAEGTLLQVLVPEGTTVKAGTVLAVIGQPGEEVQGAPSFPTQPAIEPTVSSRPQDQTASTGPREMPAAPPKPADAALRLTPVVARMMSEYGITSDELSRIPGTGEGGRVSKKDLEKYVEGRKTAAPVVPEVPAWEMPGTGELFRPTEEIFGKHASQPAARAPSPVAPAVTPVSPAGSGQKQPSPSAIEEVTPLSPIRKSIADHMVKSKLTAPHVTTVHEADMTRVIAHMKAHQDEFTKQGARLTFTPYFVQAAINALKQVPVVNALYTENGILNRRQINIGIAVAMPDGLIVPIIRQADEKSLLGLSRAVNDLATRARDRKLTPDEVQGGTFTITNYGVFGSLFGTPIINQPQSAILGVGAIQKRVIVIEDAIAIRPMVYVALTFDHRLIDGAVGDQFMTALKEFLTSYPEH